MKLSVLALLFMLTSASFAQEAAVVKFDKLQKILDEKSEKIQVINFWATWCAPCVKELPYFEMLNAENRPGIKVTLVTLDFANKLDKVNSFLVRKQMKANVILLDEIDYNSWIDKVEKAWSGAIPATLVINSMTGKRKFVEKELKDGDLDLLINEVK